MYDDVFEQDTVLDYFKHTMTLPDDYRLLRNDPLISHVIQINAMLKQFASHPDCFEVEILEELRSLLRKSKYPPILRDNWPRINELLAQAITIYKNMKYDVIAKKKKESDKKVVGLKRLNPGSRRATLNKMKTEYVKLMRTVLAKKPNTQYLQFADPRVKDIFKRGAPDKLPKQKTLQNWASEARKKTPKK